MEREKGDEEKEERFMGLKLKRGILGGKSRAGVCTPPLSWTFHSHSQQQEGHSHSDCNKVSNFDDLGNNSSVTARQLGANLWEILPHIHSIANMNKKHSDYTGKRLNQGLEIQKVDYDPPGDDHPVSTGSFHRQIAASVMRHHQDMDRNDRALQVVSPASYSSSMEVTPYYCAASPSSSLEYRGRLGDPRSSLKTSTELLKVLNRIWCLEEQHASNISISKVLKTELENARTRIKELLREKQTDRQVIDDLMKQVADHKLVRKNMEQGRLQSLRQELEDERKLRKRSESLHRKMARDISETKSSFSKALDELERERHARIHLEDLCDEFAMGIRNYEHELRSLKCKTDNEQVPKEDVDNSILHISEVWLDEQAQRRLAQEFGKDMGAVSGVVDKMRPEINTFLQAKQTDDSRQKFEVTPDFTKRGLRRQSLESYPLNQATSAPTHADDEDENESTDSESNCFELHKNLGAEYSNGDQTKYVNYSEDINVDEIVKTEIAGRNCESHEVNNGRSATGLVARFERHMERKILRDEKTRKETGVSVRTDAFHNPANQEAFAEGVIERRSARFGYRGGNSNHILDTLLRNSSSSVEGERIYPVSDLPDENHGHFSLAGPVSPVKKWEANIISQDVEISKSSSRWFKGHQENTLKARLLEARLEGKTLQKKKGS